MPKIGKISKPLTRLPDELKGKKVIMWQLYKTTYDYTNFSDNLNSYSNINEQFSLRYWNHGSVTPTKILVTEDRYYHLKGEYGA